MTAALNVLIGCESSGVVRGAFRALGHDAWSCDLLPADDGSRFHLQCDLREVLSDGHWDLIVAHPPCTYLCSSGMHWTTRGLRNVSLTEKALELVQAIMDAPAPTIAIENPVGVISTRIRRPDQYIQPYDFGHSASKKTGLWLKGLPLLRPTKHVAGRMVEWPKGSRRKVERWDNQTDSGQNRLGPSEDRWKARSKTYAGIAEAMALQWAGDAMQLHGLTLDEPCLTLSSIESPSQ
jgi:hypothetical protein